MLRADSIQLDRITGHCWYLVQSWLLAVWNLTTLWGWCYEGIVGKTESLQLYQAGVPQLSFHHTFTGKVLLPSMAPLPSSFPNNDKTHIACGLQSHIFLASHRYNNFKGQHLLCLTYSLSLKCKLSFFLSLMSSTAIHIKQVPSKACLSMEVPASQVTTVSSALYGESFWASH